MTTRIGNHQACIVCSRRADGMAVGTPDRLGWYCEICGPERAKEALQDRKFDQIEQRAAKRVAALCGTSISLEPSELPDFIVWVVSEFAKAMRTEVKGDGVPF